MLLEIKKKPNSNEVIKQSFDEIIELLEIIFEDTNDIVFKNWGKDEYYIYTVNKDSRSISIRRYYTEEHSEEVGQTLADRISRLTQS